jgi:hypothetical protein
VSLPGIALHAQVHVIHCTHEFFFLLIKLLISLHLIAHVHGTIVSVLEITVVSDC